MKRSVFTVIGVIGIVLLVGLMQFDKISAQEASNPPLPLSHITPVIWEARGNGDLLSPSFNLSSGVVVVDVSYQATSSGILEIKFLNTDGSDSHRVVYKAISEDEGYSGDLAFDVHSESATLSPGSYRIQINSEGAWHVDVSQPRRDVGLELPRFLQGSGDGGSFAFAFQSGIVPIYYEYLGPADQSGSIFGIRLYKMDGSEDERILYDIVAANELPKSGIASVTVHESSSGDITPGVYLVSVQSEGDWRIALGAESFTTPTPTPMPTTAPTEIPTGTPESIPTATPIPPSVPDEIYDRLSALETLMATLQGLIAALESRIAALEADSTPTPIPTSQPILTPQPTATPPPRGATPEPTATMAPTPTPEQPADSCVGTVSGDGTVSGSWSSDCASEGRSGSYASYHTFTLTETADVTITAESGVDTYLFLREGAGRDGSVVDENDDHDTSEFSLASTTDSGISESLDAGSYTIEVTTYTAGETGEFTLTISGLPAALTPQPSMDRAALVALYNATNGDNWTDKENWLSDEPLGEWQGVTTDDDGRVTQIRLWENNLIGSIPADLGNLTSLNLLALHINQLNGSIPMELGNLSNLTVLDLFGNQLSGQIPSELGGLANLQGLYLGENDLSGEIPAALGSLASLEELDLRDNELSGEVPEELGNLSNLTELHLCCNELSGEIPAELGNLSSLVVIGLDENQLNGEIPEELGNLSNLTLLDLPDNQLSGEIPSELGNLSNLERLYLSNNQLSGEIPAELGSLASLIELYAWNNQLSGEIPVELGRLNNLQRLNLDDNELSGGIPTELGSLSNLTVLELFGNQLSGEIPSELGNLANLRFLTLSNNQLNGGIPTELGRLTELTGLYLWGNQLSGEIPAELGNLSNLSELYLYENQLSGEIPSEFGRLSNLNSLLLQENQLSGEIPSELLALLDLEIMTLWGNQFHGDILTHSSDRNALSSLYNATSGAGWTDNEYWVTNEPVFTWYGVGIDTNGHVTALLLEDNQLTGEMPSELGSLSSLIWLHLSRNQLSGEIPPELGNLSNLEWLSLVENELSGCVPSGLINVEFNDLDDLGLPLCSDGN